MALSFDDARSLILESASPLGGEQGPLLDALSRVLADGVLAPWDMPRWNNSAMDGYAVLAASPSSAAILVSFRPGAV